MCDNWKEKCKECKYYKFGNLWKVNNPNGYTEYGVCKHLKNKKYSCYGFREGGWLGCRWKDLCGTEARYFIPKVKLTLVVSDILPNKSQGS